MIQLRIEDVIELCGARPIDIMLRAGTPEYPLSLHGEHDGYGDYFSILLGEIEYIDLAAGFPLGGLRYGDFTEIGALASKWSPLVSLYSGDALMLWSADAESFSTCRAQDLFVVVFERMACVAGSDWTRISERT